MKRTDWLIEIRDENLLAQGQVDTVDLTAQLLDNSPDTWSLEGHADPLLIQYLQNRGGIIASYKGKVKFSGPINGRVETWESNGSTKFSCTGQTDKKWLEERVCYPSDYPFTYAEDVKTGIAESVAKAFVDFNIGAGSESGRELFGLVIAGDLSGGISGTWRGRMQPLGGLLREIALQGGDLKFNIMQSNDGELTFDFGIRQDLTNDVIFTQDLGNISKIEFAQLAPSVNVVYVGGDGEGVSRPFVIRTDSASVAKWGRIEKFISTNSVVTSELEAKGDEELAKSAERFTGSVVPIETAAIYYDLWDLGDIVSLEIAGVAYPEVIRQIDIKIDPTSATVEPTIGTPENKSGDVLSQVMDAITRINSRVKNIERV